MQSITALSLGATIPSDGGALIVAVRAFPTDADADAIVSGKVAPASVIATADGGAAIIGEFHSGPEADWVYVEQYARIGDAEARTFHGFVDSESRKLVQAG